MPVIQSLVETFIRDVAELPDRSSPADWPEAMLATGEELDELLRTFAADVLTKAVHHPAVDGKAKVALIALRNAAQDGARAAAV